MIPKPILLFATMALLVDPVRGTSTPGDSFKKWVEDLGHEDIRVRADAADRFREVALDLPETLHALYPLLVSGDADLRKRGGALLRTLREATGTHVEHGEPLLPSPEVFELSKKADPKPQGKPRLEVYEVGDLSRFFGESGNELVALVELVIQSIRDPADTVDFSEGHLLIVRGSPGVHLASKALLRDLRGYVSSSAPPRPAVLVKVRALLQADAAGRDREEQGLAETGRRFKCALAALEDGARGTDAEVRVRCGLLATEYRVVRARAASHTEHRRAVLAAIRGRWQDLPEAGFDAALGSLFSPCRVRALRVVEAAALPVEVSTAADSAGVLYVLGEKRIEPAKEARPHHRPLIFAISGKGKASHYATVEFED